MFKEWEKVIVTSIPKPDEPSRAPQNCVGSLTSNIGKFEFGAASAEIERINKLRYSQPGFRPHHSIQDIILRLKGVIGYRSSV